MDLKTVFSSISAKVGQTKEAGEELLAVKISSTVVSAAPWKVTGEKVELGTVTQAQVKDESFESLLEASDKAISPATEPVDGREPNVEKVIFGLPFHWVVQGKIAQGKLDILRRLCKELGLKPLGFVLLSEALENYYKEIEGAPLTAILLEFDGEEGLLTMYRAGKNLGSVPLTANIEEINEGLEKALRQFTQAEVLPSRIIIYDGKEDLEKIAAKITSFPWTKNLPFLHFPKVEIFKSNQVVQAVAVAGGMQMGGHFEEKSEEVVLPPQELEEVSALDAGFLPETQFGEMEIPLEKSSFGQLQEMEIKSDEPAPVPQNKKVAETITIIKNKIYNFGKTLFALIPSRPNFASFSKTGKIVPMAVLLLGAALVLMGITIYTLPKVRVFLKVSSPSFDKELNVTVITEKSTGPASDSAKIVNGTLLEVSEIGTKKGVASGRKLVGEKAKGSVTIYSAAASKTFPAGTGLVSPAGLKFTLDHDVNVASGDAITRATASTTVTAGDIGDPYNLAAGTKFSIGSFSSSQYAAQADQSLSGGESHEATVVTKEDQSRLTATLSAELTQKAKTDLESKLSPGQNLLPNAITSVVSKKKFSKDIGTEGDSVSLDLTMDFTGIIFSKKDLIDVFARNFSSDIPSGFVLSPDQANIDIKDIKTDKSGNAILKTHLNSGLLPIINLKDLVKNVSGKSLSSAESFLSQIPGVTGITVETNPRFFENITKVALPWKKENIEIEIISQ